jgi:hypothetical protein
MPNLLQSVVHYDFFFQLLIVRDFGMLSEMSSAPIATDAKIHAFSNSSWLHACVDWRASCRTRCATRQVTMKDSSPEAGKMFMV